MMSMKSDGKPVSFIEDCAVPLEHLADYTERLTEVFEKHGTSGTWYAHASVGCLHVRPVLNLKLDKDAATMRAIAEEAFAMVREYKGAHSGEHGDGLVRSEFHETMFGRRMVRAFEAVKDRFDPKGLLNPGKIVRAPRMNDRTLFRFKPDYASATVVPALDWSAYPGGARGLQGAVEMCNNNGECRKHVANVMCPSFRVTRDERDVTRGRANTLRLALSGQLGPDAFASDEMLATMKLCVSCKACRRECPTGVDMAKMKIEVLAAANTRRPLPLKDRLIAYLPRYARYARPLAFLMNLRDRVPGMAALSERLLGFTARRRLPQWRTAGFRLEGTVGPAGGREVALFADTFNSSFEPENLHAAVDVLVRLGYRVSPLQSTGGRPVCCGRTFLSAGLVEEARAEARRLIAAAQPFVARGVPIIGLEPSCLLTLKDEFPAMLPGEGTARIAPLACLFEDFLAAEIDAGRIKGPDRTARGQGPAARPLPPEVVWLHAGGGEGLVAGRRHRGRAGRKQLLRHGRRVRLRGRHLRDIAGDGRADAAAGRAQGIARDHHRRRRLLLPASDRRRLGPRGAPCRPHPARCDDGRAGVIRTVSPGGYRR